MKEREAVRHGKNPGKTQKVKAETSCFFRVVF